MEIDYKEIATYAIILVIVLILAQHLNVVVSGSMEPVFYRGDIVAIENMKLANILKKERFLLKIDFDNLNKTQYKRLLKRLLLIKKIVMKNKMEIVGKTLSGFFVCS